MILVIELFKNKYSRWLMNTLSPKAAKSCISFFYTLLSPYNYYFFLFLIRFSTTYDEFNAVLMFMVSIQRRRSTHRDSKLD
jgi:hypothetical protein